MTKGKRLLVIAALPLLAVLLIAVEVVIAVRAARLPDMPPYDLRRPAAEAKHVVWLGDSTAAGVGASSADTALAVQLNHRTGDPDLTVLAVSGARVEDVLRDQLPKVADAKPDIVYISVGANDTTGRTSRRTFERKYERLLNSLPPNAEVVALGVPDMGGPTRVPQPLRFFLGRRGSQLDEVVKKVAGKHGAKYVDIEGFTRNAFRKHPGQYFSLDRFHPNDDGYRLWVDAICTSVTCAAEGTTGP